MAKAYCGHIKLSSEGNQPCPKPATNACGGCFLIQYCSRECQTAHWSIHKKDCRSPYMKSNWKPGWEIENRVPSFVTSSTPVTPFGGRKYLWGNMPALDILNLDKNEGKDTQKNFRLLFAASGDLRNVVRTLNGFPSNWKGRCEMMINDRDETIVARNAILLLIAIKLEPTQAATAMSHIWYSATLPKGLLDDVCHALSPVIQEVLEKSSGKPSHTPLSKRFEFDDGEIRLVLSRETWSRLPTYLAVRDDKPLAAYENTRRAITLAPARKDYLERNLLDKPRGHRMGMLKFRHDGILLPFAHDRQTFNTPNPTIYGSDGSWPMKDSADPLDGWSIDEVLKISINAKEDLYGKLYFHLLDTFSRFCQNIRQNRVSFFLSQADARHLGGLMRQYKVPQASFDRIEVSNISDAGYLGVSQTISLLGPLLKSRAQNHHATLLMLFLNAIHQVKTRSDTLRVMISSQAEIHRLLSFDMTKMNPPNKHHSMVIRKVAYYGMFLDFDELFDRYAAVCDFSTICAISGFQIKAKHTIVEPWPLRISLAATKEQFDNLCASSHDGSERYLEWKRK